MCGIAGIVKKDGSEVTTSEIKNITNIFAHRGPDDEGFFIENNFALGHRRLSILDLSPAGHQPMLYNHVRIIFNGEIYNYIEIKDELKKSGYSFHTGTDTEVIAAAYIHWGEDCVNRFNGMWAFVIYDEDKQIFFCSRDRFGVKPFYYVNNSSIFAFGSEIKQLHVLGFHKVNLKILFDYLYISYQNHTADTFFKDVYQLEPSHNLIFDLKNNDILIKKYYTLELQKEVYNLNLESSEAYYEDAIRDAIILRLRSDVKVGTCLSGGLDSSFIASVAAENYHQTSNNQFTSITAKSADALNDETEYAKMVIEKSKLDGKIVEPSFEHILDDIEKIVYHQEEPFGSPSIFMQYYVMKAAKEYGCIVLLDGQGGDETLLGYERYYMSFLRNVPLKKLLKWFRKIQSNSKLTMKDVINYYIYFNFPKVRVNHLRKRLSGIKKEYRSYLNNDLIYEYADSSKQVFSLQKLEITKTQLRALLNYEDKNSMAWSIETRLPFLDYRVAEAAISIKPEYKINDGWSKFLLRRIGSKVLPHEIAWRKNKIGFEAPKKFWDLHQYMETIINSSNILHKIFYDATKIKDPIMKWKLFSIALWEKKFVMELD